MMKFLSAALILSAVGVFVGCTESGPQPVKVTGSVTLDGAPMAEGFVMFRSVAEGTLDSIPVKDGKFSGRALPGERRVEIGAYDTVVSDPGGPMESKVQINRVAPEFGDESKLTAKVDAAGPNEFTFEAKSKGNRARDAGVITFSSWRRPPESRLLLPPPAA